MTLNHKTVQKLMVKMNLYGKRKMALRMLDNVFKKTHIQNKYSWLLTVDSYGY